MCIYHCPSPHGNLLTSRGQTPAGGGWWGEHTDYWTSRQAGTGASGHLAPACLHLHTRLAKGEARGPGQFRACGHPEQLRKSEAGEPQHERQATEMAAYPRAREVPLRAPGSGEPRVQREVRTLNHVYSGTNRGPLLHPSPLPLRQKFTRASALNPRNPPESLLRSGGGGRVFHFNLFLSLPSPPTEFLCWCFWFLWGYFFSFLEGVGGRE